MLKRTFFLTILLFSVTVSGQNISTELSKNEEVISRFMQLSQQQLYDTAKYFFKRNIIDTALICNNILINTIPKDANIELQKIVIGAYIDAAIVYRSLSDYRTAYEYLIKALILAEKYNYDRARIRIYNNIGNIYGYLSRFDMAKTYFFKALDLCPDSSDIVVILNNLGAVDLTFENIDSALYYLDKAVKISKQHDNVHLHAVLNTTALVYKKNKHYDSAYHYFKTSLNYVKNNNLTEREVHYLSNIGQFFFEINNPDSALFYIYLSNKIAEENKFLYFEATNYQILSTIEESKGNIRKAYNYLKKHSSLKDSLLNAKTFGDIDQLQRIYEVSKTNEQIEKLILEQQIKERTIRYQKIIWLITLFVLLLVSTGLLVIYLQKRKLNKAYEQLFAKNIEIIEFQKSPSEKKLAKSKPTTDTQTKIINKILSVMENTVVICDPTFSLNRLSSLVDCNSKYVSDIINTALNKNFRSLLNSYRIKEAQRMFSLPNTSKYTVEFVANEVGYKSRNSFCNIFKDITGVCPSYYLKSLNTSTSASHPATVGENKREGMGEWVNE